MATRVAMRPWMLAICLVLSGVGDAVANSPVFHRDHLSRVWNEEFSAPIRANDLALPRAAYGSDLHLRSNCPHPAVARVIVPEGNATSYGSGTLVDVRGEFGLVVTNWHVVRDAQGPVEVLFPGDFRSKARALKVDADWDLAALVIWRPPVDPVPLANRAPRPGDQLTICGYGQGSYRAKTGRCTQYYAPHVGFPQQMVGLDVEARQGDSGGPIFNQQGELAGVLFGAGEGTTLGSFGGRVETFLATLASDIGQTGDAQLAHGDCLPPPLDSASPISPPATDRSPNQPAPFNTASSETDPAESDDDRWRPTEEQLATGKWFEQVKTVLAAIGVMAIASLVLRAVR